MRTHGTEHVSRSIGQPQLSKFTTRYVSTWQWPKSSVRAAQRVGDSKQDRWNTDSKGTRSEKGEPGHKRQEKPGASGEGSERVPMVSAMSWAFA